MLSLEGHRVIDLTVQLESRIYRLDGTLEEGSRDVYGMPWMIEEYLNNKDNTIEAMLGLSLIHI